MRVNREEKVWSKLPAIEGDVAKADGRSFFTLPPFASFASFLRNATTTGEQRGRGEREQSSERLSTFGVRRPIGHR
jgi:hypothetical protein